MDDLRTNDCEQLNRPGQKEPESIWRKIEKITLEVATFTFPEIAETSATCSWLCAMLAGRV